MNKRKPLSPIRRRYILRLILRVAVLIFCAVWLIHDPSQADILRGWNFFRKLSPFHVLWVLWIVDMLWQLIPVQKNLHIALGSQKHFRFRFQPVAEKINYPALRDHIISTTKAAYKVFLIWIAVVALVSFLRYFNVLDDAALFLITIAFYVCDHLRYNAKDTPTPRTVFAEDAEHPGNCMAYAHSFLFLGDLADIPCILVHSETHQWNEVWVGGRWMSVDVGGDDAWDAAQRQGVTVLHEATELQGEDYIQTDPALTRFVKELLVPGSTEEQR